MAQRCVTTQIFRTPSLTLTTDSRLYLETWDPPKLLDILDLELKWSRSNAVRLSSYPSNRISIVVTQSLWPFLGHHLLFHSSNVDWPILKASNSSTTNSLHIWLVNGFLRWSTFLLCFFVMLFLLGTLPSQPLSLYPTLQSTVVKTLSPGSF